VLGNQVYAKASNIDGALPGKRWLWIKRVGQIADPGVTAQPVYVCSLLQARSQRHNLTTP